MMSLRGILLRPSWNEEEGMIATNMSALVFSPRGETFTATYAMEAGEDPNVEYIGLEETTHQNLRTVCIRSYW